MVALWFFAYCIWKSYVRITGIQTGAIKNACGRHLLMRHLACVLSLKEKLQIAASFKCHPDIMSPHLFLSLLPSVCLCASVCVSVYLCVSVCILAQLSMTLNRNFPFPMQHLRILSGTRMDLKVRYVTT
jgi:hypothetical protein